MLTRVVLGISLGLLLLFAYLTAIRPAFAMAYALILLFILTMLWPRQAVRGLMIRRHLDAGTPTVGEPFEETFTVSKPGWVPAPWVEVTDLSRIPDYQPGRIVSLGREPVTWTGRGSYRHRGWITFGPTEVRISEPFGLFTQNVRLNQRNQVLVYPRIRPLPELVMPAAQHAGTAPRFGHWAYYPLLMVLLFWIVGGWLAWCVLRWRQPLLGLVPGAVAFATNILNYPADQNGYTLAFLVLTLALLLWTTYQRSLEQADRIKIR